MKEFLTKDKQNRVKRVSRWIQIKQAYNVTKRNGLFEFSTDENGYTPAQENYNPETGTFLDYFRFRGRNYAINQFIALCSPFCGGVPYEFTDTDWKSTFIHAVDFYGDLYNPLYIELEDGGERVRGYEVRRA